MNVVVLGSWTRGERFRKMVWQSKVFDGRLFVGDRSKKKSFKDGQKIFYVTYGHKLTILHPLEVEVREKIRHQYCQNTRYKFMSHFYHVLTPI